MEWILVNSWARTMLRWSHPPSMFHGKLLLSTSERSGDKKPARLRGPAQVLSGLVLNFLSLWYKQTDFPGLSCIHFWKQPFLPAHCWLLFTVSFPHFLFLRCHVAARTLPKAFLPLKSSTSFRNSFSEDSELALPCSCDSDSVRHLARPALPTAAVRCAGLVGSSVDNRCFLASCSSHGFPPCDCVWQAWFWFLFVYLA